MTTLHDAHVADWWAHECDMMHMGDLGRSIGLALRDVWLTGVERAWELRCKVVGILETL